MRERFFVWKSIKFWDCACKGGNKKHRKKPFAIGRLSETIGNESDQSLSSRFFKRKSGVRINSCGSIRNPLQILRTVERLQDLHLPSIMLDTVEVGIPLSIARRYEVQSRSLSNWMMRVETAAFRFIRILLLCKSWKYSIMHKNGSIPKNGKFSEKIKVLIKKFTKYRRIIKLLKRAAYNSKVRDRCRYRCFGGGSFCSNWWIRKNRLQKKKQNIRP